MTAAESTRGPRSDHSDLGLLGAAPDGPGQAPDQTQQDLVQALANFGPTATSTQNLFGGSPSADFLIRDTIAQSPDLLQALLRSNYFGV